MKDVMGRVLWGIFCLLPVLLVACTSVGTSMPEGMLETMVAATIQALPSLTLQPAATLTVEPTLERPTATDLPSETPPPSLTLMPTFTPTLTDTPIPTATPAGYNFGKKQGDAKFGCVVLAQFPADGFEASPGQDIAVTWRIRNIGSRSWDKESTDIGYVSGEKMAIGGTLFDLSKTVPAGQIGDIMLTFEAPKNKGAGTYRTIWSLFRGSTPFCEFSFSLVVK
jgi:hypothetical protein